MTRIDAEQVQIKSEFSQSTHKWSAYAKFKETRNLFIFYLDARVFEILPKRAFSEAQVEELRKYLQGNNLAK